MKVGIVSYTSILYCKNLKRLAFFVNIIKYNTL